jgi:hypothetical protein
MGSPEYDGRRAEAGNANLAIEANRPKRRDSKEGKRRNQEIRM